MEADSRTDLEGRQIRVLTLQQAKDLHELGVPLLMGRYVSELETRTSRWPPDSYTLVYATYEE